MTCLVPGIPNRHLPGNFFAGWDVSGPLGRMPLPLRLDPFLAAHILGCAFKPFF